MIEFLEVFGYGFFQRALIAGFLIGVLSSLIGVFLVLKRLSLLGDSFAHASFGGIALGFVLNWNPLLTAIGFVTLASLGIDKLINRLKLYGESAIALVLSFGMAFALVLIGVKKRLDVNIFSYLFGSILTISWSEIFMMCGVLVLVGLFFYFFYGRLVFSAFNFDVARVRDKSVVWVDKVFVVLCAVVIVISIRAVGILLISALLVVPSLVGLNLGRSFKQTLFFACVSSVFGIYLGIFVSYFFDLPAGGTIVLSLILLFLGSFLVKRS